MSASLVDLKVRVPTHWPELDPSRVRIRQHLPPYRQAQVVAHFVTGRWPDGIIP